MQNRYQTHFDDRAIFYLSADLYAQSEKGDDWNYKLTPVYGVFLMNFEWRNVEEQHLREDVCLYNLQTNRVFSDKLRMTFLKIPMMIKEADECETTLERWLYLLKHMDKMEAIPQSFTKEPVFRNLNRVARYAALTETDKKAYKDSLKAYRDAYAVYETEQAIGEQRGIKKGIEIGQARGIEIGQARGIEIGQARGIEIGQARGIEIGQARGMIKVAKKMKMAGRTIEEIAAMTDLPISEIEKL